jgi:hypothetical protein
MADLNGDGWMEVVVDTTHYEGFGVTVYELQPEGTLGEVLSRGCGA